MGRKDQPGSGGSSSRTRPPLKRHAVAASIRLRWRRPDDRLIVTPKRLAERNKKHARQIPLGPLAAGQIDQLCALHKLADPEALVLGQANGRPLTTHLNKWLPPWDHTSHDLRRWFLSTLMGLGCPPEIRHDLVGHTKSNREAARDRHRKAFDKASRWSILGVSPV